MTKRTRPMISATVNQEIVNAIDRMVLQTRMKKSRVIELCIGFGLTKFEQNYVTKAEVTDISKISRDKGQEISDRYMKSVITDVKDESRWTAA